MYSTPPPPPRRPLIPPPTPAGAPPLYQHTPTPPVPLLPAITPPKALPYHQPPPPHQPAPQPFTAAPPPHLTFSVPPPVQYVSPSPGQGGPPVQYVPPTPGQFPPPPGYALAPALAPPGYPAAPHYIPYPTYPSYPPGYTLPTQQQAPSLTPTTYKYSQPPPVGPGPSQPPPPPSRERSPVWERRLGGESERGRERGVGEREGGMRVERGANDRERDIRGRRKEGAREVKRVKEDRRVKDHRERGRRDKDRRQENLPSAFKKTGQRIETREGGEQDRSAPSLVPYEDDSGGEENNKSVNIPADGGKGRGEMFHSSRGSRDREGSSRDKNRGEKGVGRSSGGRDRRSRSPPPRVKKEPSDKDYSRLSPEEVIEQEKKVWIRSAPADLYYNRDPTNPGIMRATDRSLGLQTKFRSKLVEAAQTERAKVKVEEPPRPRVGHVHRDEEEEDSDSDEEDLTTSHKVESLDWLEFRSKAANRAHPEVWQNMPGELNDGPACRCSKKARESGIRHGTYVGESSLPSLDMASNNWDKLHHYRVTISPPTNFLIKNPTIIAHDEHEFIFEGFSMLTVDKIPDLPVCKVVRFNIEYNILYFEEKMPENFTLGELDLFHEYFFRELLELWDWSVDGRFYFMPRFVRDLSENGKEILSMNEVLHYLVQSYQPLIEEMDLVPMTQMAQSEWTKVADKTKGMLVTLPANKPSTLRVDQLDREQDSAGVIKYPDIVHFGVRPPQLSYAGSQEYQKAWREFVKFRHLLANMAKPTFKDRRELEAKEHALQEMRSNTKLKRDCTAVISAQGYLKTGLMTDIVQHAMLLPVLVNHVRLHNSLHHLETRIKYKFNNRYLLQQAVTHPSYKENFGTNPDHIRNTLSNCGIRQPEYGDKKIHYQNTRKRGINMLINIMSRFGKKNETESKVQHNERLEFLGDAVVEFITSVHLFYMFPDLEEGGLATYRAAIVQNQHLAILAEGLGLEKYMLYAHGSDLCHDSELKHAMANCFEALMGAIFLDGGIDVADRVFSDAMFGSEFDLFDTWIDLPAHPLQTQEPGGDRHWIPKFPVLQKLTQFEDMTGIEFDHVRLLARAFTDRSIGFNNLTLGSNQRMEFLGDTVLQLITSDFLYKHFPDHHEGHLSLLRSSLVNNRTQSVVCDDLGMTRFAVYANPKGEIKVKDKADLLEAFLGALYVDKDLEWCEKFAHVCFFPRLQQFILNQDWNDPKSKLQQCCLTLRTMDGGEPDIPVYKVIECKGPTNTRVYTVAVYFRGERLAKDYGHSIQQAEMNAAKIALENRAHLFPHLNYQKRIMERSFKRQGVGDVIRDNWYNETLKKRAELGMDKKEDVKIEVKEETEQVAGSSEDVKIEVEVSEPEGIVPYDAESKQGNVCSGKELDEIPDTAQGETGECDSLVTDKTKRDNREQVKREIKEIEAKLARKQLRKKTADMEDGECIDTDEDTDLGEEGTKRMDTVPENPEDIAKRKKEENKKRWKGPSAADDTEVSVTNSLTENKDESPDKVRKESQENSGNRSSKEDRTSSRSSSRSGAAQSRDRGGSSHSRERDSTSHGRDRDSTSRGRGRDSSSHERERDSNSRCRERPPSRSRGREPPPHSREGEPSTKSLHRSREGHSATKERDRPASERSRPPPLFPPHDASHQRSSFMPPPHAGRREDHPTHHRSDPISQSRPGPPPHQYQGGPPPDRRHERRDDRPPYPPSGGSQYNRDNNYYRESGNLHETVVNNVMLEPVVNMSSVGRSPQVSSSSCLVSVQGSGAYRDLTESQGLPLILLDDSQVLSLEEGVFV